MYRRRRHPLGCCCLRPQRWAVVSAVEWAGGQELARWGGGATDDDDDGGLDTGGADVGGRLLLRRLQHWPD